MIIQFRKLSIVVRKTIRHQATVKGYLKNQQRWDDHENNQPWGGNFDIKRPWSHNPQGNQQGATASRNRAAIVRQSQT